MATNCMARYIVKTAKLKQCFLSNTTQLIIRNLHLFIFIRIIVYEYNMYTRIVVLKFVALCGSAAAG